MTTINIEQKSYILSKESLMNAKAIWKDLSKNKKATLSHHVFYFLLTSHDPEKVFKKAFSPLVNPNKINQVNGDVYFAVKQELIALTSSSINLNYIQPWLTLLLKDDEYEIKGNWSKVVKTESDIINDIREKAKNVLNVFNKIKEA